MKILLKDIKQKVDMLVKSTPSDVIGFIPPTICREVQIMTYLVTLLKIDLPEITIQKISGIIPVPQ
ncbi:MAG: hypothetical protein ABI472_10135 [Ginsengibacter sp.]